jgi:hypothetical protein
VTGKTFDDRVSEHLASLGALVQRARDEEAAYDPATNRTQAAILAEADALEAAAARMTARSHKLRHAAAYIPPVPTDDELRAWIVDELGDDPAARAIFDQNIAAGFSELDAVRFATPSDWEPPEWWRRAQRSGRRCAQGNAHHNEETV